MLRLIRWSASALIVLLLLGWAGAWLAARDPSGPVGEAAAAVRGLFVAVRSDAPAGVPRLGGAFTLVDQHGHPVSDTDFRGRWMLLYFGYTYCPDVCPTELQTIAAALDRLGPEASKIAPLFVTIDPDRDTPPVMADYVKLFDDRLIGLTGTPEQIRHIAQIYRVYYAKVTPPGATDYVMDHSSLLYLMGPDGSLRALLRPGGTAAEMAEAIGRQLHATPPAPAS